WHWKGAEPPGQAKSDIEIMAGLYLRIRELYVTEGGAFPDPIVNLAWNYARAAHPSAAELAMEYNGRALQDLADPRDPTRITRRKGEQVSGFGELRDDGSTACG